MTYSLPRACGGKHLYPGAQRPSPSSPAQAGVDPRAPAPNPTNPTARHAELNPHGRPGSSDRRCHTPRTRR